MVTSDFRPEVEIKPFRACAMHPAIIMGTVRSLFLLLGLVWGTCKCFTPLCPVRHCNVYTLVFLCCSEQINDDDDDDDDDDCGRGYGAYTTFHRKYL